MSISQKDKNEFVKQRSKFYNVKSLLDNLFLVNAYFRIMSTEVYVLQCWEGYQHFSLFLLSLFLFYHTRDILYPFCCLDLYDYFPKENTPMYI